MPEKTKSQPASAVEHDRDQSVNVRFDRLLIEALREAGEVRGLSNMSEIMRAAAVAFVAEAAHDDRPMQRLQERQERLRQFEHDHAPRAAGTAGRARNRRSAPRPVGRPNR